MRLHRKASIRFAVMAAVIVFNLSSTVMAIAITITGAWSPTIDESYLAAGAGSELVSSVESLSDLATISISDTGSPDVTWLIEAKIISSAWHDDLDLHVRRSSDGTGPGSISGGSNYLGLTATFQTLATGSGDRSGVLTQLKITGLSTILGINNFDATITYRVVVTSQSKNWEMPASSSSRFRGPTAIVFQTPVSDEIRLVRSPAAANRQRALNALRAPPKKTISMEYHGGSKK